jgi:tetratricopeptide (TPR) repeat protein
VTHGADHRETLITRYNMALSLYTQKLYDDALSMFEQVLEMQLSILPLDDPQTLKTMKIMAATLSHLKRLDESLKMYEDLVPKLIRVIGDDHDDTLDGCDGLYVRCTGPSTSSR